MNALIDTNIILDAVMSRAPFNKAAEDVILLAAEEKITACITASSVTDLYYILRKHMQDKEQAKHVIFKLIAIVNVLDVTATDCEKAFELPMSDYEDALQAYCAMRNKADCIIMRNTKHFEGSPVKAISPDDFLKTI